MVRLDGSSWRRGASYHGAEDNRTGILEGIVPFASALPPSAVITGLVPVIPML
jgi:hypothetical protein